jgi:ribosomal protein S18 acetylase RimI-like enzyme
MIERIHINSSKDFNKGRLLELHQQLKTLYESSFNKSYLGDIQFPENSDIFVLQNDGQIIAALGVTDRDTYPVTDELVDFTQNNYIVYNICSDPLHRRKGYVKYLLRSVFQILAAEKDPTKNSYVYLIVKLENVGAISLYNNLDFESLGQLRIKENVYAMMVKNITKNKN